MNRYILLVLICFTVIGAVSISLLSRPKTGNPEFLEPVFTREIRFGDISLKGFNLEESGAQLEDRLELPKVFHFNAKAVELTPREMGFSINHEAFATYFNFCKKNSCNEIDNSTLQIFINVDDEKFQKAVKELEESLIPLLTENPVDFDEGSFKAFDDQAQLSINSEVFTQDLKLSIYKNGGEVMLPTKLSFPGGVEKQAEATTNLLEKITAQKLWVKTGRNQDFVPQEELLKLFHPISDENSVTSMKFDEAAGKVLLASIMDEDTYKVAVNPDEGVRAIMRAMIFRAGGEDYSMPLIIPLIGTPKTDGSLVNKYIEFNKPQQRAYAFEGGRLKKTYLVGTGLTSETPSGNFAVRDKVRLTISYVHNWYMPYYLPIGDIDGQWQFGFHELPYKLDPSRGIVARNIRTMGSPATGGCIQLTPKDAIEVYNWAEIGMPVVILD